MKGKRQEVKMICKLKNLMEKRGLSQKALAEATGISPTTVGKLYRNEFSRVDNNTTITLCKFFNVGIADLYEVVKE